MKKRCIFSYVTQEHSDQGQGGGGMGSWWRGTADGLRDVPPPVAEEELCGREEEEEQENNRTRRHRPGWRGQAAGIAQR